MTVIAVPKQQDMVSYLAQQKTRLSDLHTEVAELEELTKTGLNLFVDGINNRHGALTKMYCSREFSRATDVSLEKSLSTGENNHHSAQLYARFSFPVQTPSGEIKIYCSDEHSYLAAVVTGMFQLKKNSFKYRVYHNWDTNIVLGYYSNRGAPTDLVRKASELIEAIHIKYPYQDIKGNEIEAQVIQEQPAFRELFFN